MPSTISTAARASVRNASMRVRVPGSTIADASRKPGHARHGDAAQLEHAVRDDELEERPTVPRADREPRDRAEQDPVLDQHVQRAEPEQDAAREREERHLDVVREDPRGEVGLLVDRHAEILARRRAAR